MIFQYSDTWDDIWWAWHLLRLAAYIMTLLFVGNRHFQLASDAYQNQGYAFNDECRNSESGKDNLDMGNE